MHSMFRAWRILPGTQGAILLPWEKSFLLRSGKRAPQEEEEEEEEEKILLW